MNQKYKNKIWAKSTKKNGEPVLLEEHINDLIKVFEDLKKNIPDDIRECVKLAIILHDIGKVLPTFQIKTLGNRDYKPFLACFEVPHSLLSALFINKEELKKKVGEYDRFVISAVAYHHWRSHFDEIISSSESELSMIKEELDKELEDDGGKREKTYKILEEKLISEIGEILSEDKNLISFDCSMAKGLERGVPFIEYAPPPYKLYWTPKRVGLEEKEKRDWVLISGFLMRCDHLASFMEAEGKHVSETKNISFNKIKVEVRGKILGKDQQNEIWQNERLKEENERGKNVILVAPTGCGKTEFAFLWSNGEKFFYTLPLRSAVNQIYERAKGIFGEGVGLLHSDADIYLFGDGGENQSNLKSYDLARQLLYPVIISTGDQFFPYALRPPGYEKIYATFSYSRLVIDEIQAYDPKAVAIIIKFIEDVIRMGGKFLIITATLPKFVKEEINKVIGNSGYELINLYEEKKEELSKVCKHKIEFDLIDNSSTKSFDIPCDRVESILKEAKEGKRVLVIANTVKQAQNIFGKLGDLIKCKKEYRDLEESLWLLHSRFTLKDREEKEKLLENQFKNPKEESETQGKILVATQVVEASLDIDADVLFTEIAPLDALVQRMGRVLRRYGPAAKDFPTPEKPNVHIWVFKKGSHSGQHRVYDEKLVQKTLELLVWKSAKELEKLNKTSITLSEYDKFTLVEKLYELPDDHDYLVEFRQTKDILDAGYMSDQLEDARKMFREIYTILVIPEGRKKDFLNEVKQLLEGDLSYTSFKEKVLAKFAVPIPYAAGQTRRDQSVANWIEELCELEEDYKKKLLRNFCKDVYFTTKYEYDDKKGIVPATSSSYIDIAIL